MVRSGKRAGRPQDGAAADVRSFKVDTTPSMNTFIVRSVAPSTSANQFSSKREEATTCGSINLNITRDNDPPNDDGIQVRQRFFRDFYRPFGRAKTKGLPPVFRHANVVCVS